MADDRRYQDKAWIETRYINDELTQREIAHECGVHVKTIRRWMKRHGIRTRKPAGEYHGLHGKKRSEETKAKISETMEGRKFSEVTREKIAAAQRGSRLPESTRNRISASLAGRPKSEETRRKMAAARGSKWKGDHSVPVKYGAGWTEARKSALGSQPVCQYCGHDGAEYDLDIHHLIPVRHFIAHDDLNATDAHFQANLVVLCRPCHVKAEHGKIEEFAPLDDVPSSELETFIKDHRNPSNASQ